MTFSDTAKHHIQGLKPPLGRQKAAGGRTIMEALKSMTIMQWAFFFSGWLAWTCDAIDFFSVSLSVKRLQTALDRDTTHITQSITLTLLFRSVGAVIFGILSDRYGRKWPLVFNMWAITALQIGTSFVHDFKAFLAVRSIFGIFMGGVWGMAASVCLENIPVELRGIGSGILQQGYAVGYLIAAVINLYLVPSTKHTWQALFWTAAGLSFFAGVVRLVLPESAFFLQTQEEKRVAREYAASNGGPVETRSKSQIFIAETAQMLKKHWLLCIYATLLMTGFNFLSHGSQDLYPTYLKESKGFTDHAATVATIIGNCGAIAGGVFAGWLSQYLGRRLTIFVMVCWVACFIPLWILPGSFSSLSAGAFFLQFGVQGAWGVVPIALAEMSPPGFRATFPGVMYQLGNMVSSASAQIEATGGKHLRTTLNGEDIPDYARVQGILLGVVVAYLAIVTLLGPENHGSTFEEVDHNAVGHAMPSDDTDPRFGASEKQKGRDSTSSIVSIKEKELESGARDERRIENV